MVAGLGVSVSICNQRTQTEKHSGTSCGENCLSTGGTRRPEILTEVFQDSAVFITSSASCLGGGLGCGVCTFGCCGCLNFPCSIAFTALGLGGAGSVTVAPSAAHTLALCWTPEFVSLGGNGLVYFLSRYKEGVPSFESINKVNSKTVNPAAGDGKNPAKEWHSDI